VESMNEGGDSHSCFPHIKDKNSLSPHIFQIDRRLQNLRVDVFAAMPHTYDNEDKKINLKFELNELKF
jgi:hypothetical protein